MPDYERNKMKLNPLMIVAVMIGTQTVTGQSPAGTEADELAKLESVIKAKKRTAKK